MYSSIAYLPANMIMKRSKQISALEIRIPRIQQNMYIPSLIYPVIKSVIPRMSQSKHAANTPIAIPTTTFGLAGINSAAPNKQIKVIANVPILIKTDLTVSQAVIPANMKAIESVNSPSTIQFIGTDFLKPGEHNKAIIVNKYIKTEVNQQPSEMQNAPKSQSAAAHIRISTVKNSCPATIPKTLRTNDIQSSLASSSSVTFGACKSAGTAAGYDQFTFGLAYTGGGGCIYCYWPP